VNSAKTNDAFLATNRIKKTVSNGAKIEAIGISKEGKAKSPTTTENAANVPVTSQMGKMYSRTFDLACLQKRSVAMEPMISVISSEAKIANIPKYISKMIFNSSRPC
jgi:predicted secreted protein